MRKYLSLLLVFVMIMSVMTGCGSKTEVTDTNNVIEVTPNDGSNILNPIPEDEYEGVEISLADSNITVDGVAISEDETSAVYKANDIVYYEEGKDITYGEGTESDAHSKEVADAHTVIHITEPGQYILSGNLSKGQIAVDLGKEAKEDPNAVVTLVLKQVNITCEVAPAIIFYNVYECGIVDEEKATKDVDTSNAGANIIVSDDTFNIINGSYVARIYKPDSVELNPEGTEVVEAKKLHKYDGAVYSKMSMNVNGGSAGTGILVINAENEGLDTELHLTINGGCIQIESGNDGINTNEDNVSVTTINGGTLSIIVNGNTGEGDGIDSNGWLVINGGTVYTQACSTSMDAGIDSDRGIHINGGRVLAYGNMLDRIADSEQGFVVFNFADRQMPGEYMIKDSNDNSVILYNVTNEFTYMLVSNTNLVEGEYTLWYGEQQYKGAASAEMGNMMPPMGGEMPKDFDPSKMNGERPEGMPENFNGNFENMPKGFDPSKMNGDFTPPEGGFKGEFPGNNPGGDFGSGPKGPNGNMPNQALEYSEIFKIVEGANYFVGVTAIN